LPGNIDGDVLLDGVGLRGLVQPTKLQAEIPHAALESEIVRVGVQMISGARELERRGIHIEEV
jgi:hypothetical protein